jgi:hypothetical protein
MHNSLINTFTVPRHLMLLSMQTQMQSHTKLLIVLFRGDVNYCESWNLGFYPIVYLTVVGMQRCYVMHACGGF